MLCVILGRSQFRVEKDESNLKAPFTRGFTSFGRRWPGLSLANPEIIPRFGLSRSLSLCRVPVFQLKNLAASFFAVSFHAVCRSHSRTTDFNAIPHTTIQESHSLPFSLSLPLSPSLFLSFCSKLFVSSRSPILDSIHHRQSTSRWKIICFSLTSMDDYLKTEIMGSFSLPLYRGSWLDNKIPCESARAMRGDRLPRGPIKPRRSPI